MTKQNNKMNASLIITCYDNIDSKKILQVCFNKIFLLFTHNSDYNDKAYKVIRKLTVVPLLFISLIGCTSTKKVDKVITNESKIVKVDSVVKVNSDSTKVSSEEKIKTSDNTVEFFTPYDFMVEGCDTIYVPKIVYRPDGSFEATGVKRVNLKLTEWQKKYDSLTNEYNLEINKRLVLEQELKNKTIVKDKETKPVVVAWFLFLVIGFITGFYAKHKLK